jgi:hypothetical protein
MLTRRGAADLIPTSAVGWSHSRGAIPPAPVPDHRCVSSAPPSSGMVVTIACPAVMRIADGHVHRGGEQVLFFQHATPPH